MRTITHYIFLSLFYSKSFKNTLSEFSWQYLTSAVCTVLGPFNGSALDVTVLCEVRPSLGSAYSSYIKTIWTQIPPNQIPAKRAIMSIKIQTAPARAAAKNLLRNSKQKKTAAVSA